MDTDFSTLLDSSLTASSLFPFLWLADDPDSLWVIKNILEQAEANTSVRKRLDNFISSRLEELMPDGKLRETLDNRPRPSENGVLIGGEDWGDGRQAARLL